MKALQFCSLYCVYPSAFGKFTCIFTAKFVIRRAKLNIYNTTGNTYVFFHVLTLAGSRGRCLNTRPIVETERESPDSNMDFRSFDNGLKQLYELVSMQDRHYYYLSYNVASDSEITPCNTIDKPLVVLGFTGTVMTSITTLRT